jgi:hypothetical protein
MNGDLMNQNIKSYKGWQRAKAVIACSLALCLSLLGTPIAYAADSTTSTTSSKSLKADTVEIEDIKSQIIEVIVEAYDSQYDMNVGGAYTSEYLLHYLNDKEVNPNGTLPDEEMKPENYNKVNYTYTETFAIDDQEVTNVHNCYMYTVKTYPAEPSVTITDGDKTLEQGTDYELEYSNNADLGTATVTIKGLNDYAGSSTETTFNIDGVIWSPLRSYNPETGECGVQWPTAEWPTAFVGTNRSQFIYKYNGAYYLFSESNHDATEESVADDVSTANFHSAVEQPTYVNGDLENSFIKGDQYKALASDEDQLYCTPLDSVHVFSAASERYGASTASIAGLVKLDFEITKRHFISTVNNDLGMTDGNGDYVYSLQSLISGKAITTALSSSLSSSYSKSATLTGNYTSNYALYTGADNLAQITADTLSGATSSLITGLDSALGQDVSSLSSVSWKADLSSASPTSVWTENDTGKTYNNIVSLGQVAVTYSGSDLLDKIAEFVESGQLKAGKIDKDSYVAGGTWKYYVYAYDISNNASSYKNQTKYSTNYKSLINVDATADSTALPHGVKITVGSDNALLPTTEERSVENVLEASSVIANGEGVNFDIKSEIPSKYYTAKLQVKNAAGEWVDTDSAAAAGTYKLIIDASGNKYAQAPIIGTAEQEFVVADHAAASTWSTDETNHWKQCAIAGHDDIQVVAAAHTFGDWIETPATCTEAGSKIRTCNVCGYEQTEELPVIAHTFGEWVVETPATVGSAGLKVRTCSVCGYQETETISALEYIKVYRLFNKITGEHLFTTDLNEYNVLYQTGEWNQEGMRWKSPVEGNGTPVYRLFNKVTGEHLYTKDQNEIKVQTATGEWVFDNNGNPIFYSADKSVGTPIYRLFDIRQQPKGSHHYTEDLHEYNVLGADGWSQENIAFYALELS